MTSDRNNGRSTSEAMTLAGRIFMGIGFLAFGLTKLLDIGGTMVDIAKHGLPLPESVFWLSVAIEVGTGLALIAGYKLRPVACFLVFYCLFTAAFFHHSLVNLAQRDQLLKNLIMAGGFLYVAASGAGRPSPNRLRSLS